MQKNYIYYCKDCQKLYREINWVSECMVVKVRKLYITNDQYTITTKEDEVNAEVVDARYSCVADESHAVSLCQITPPAWEWFLAHERKESLECVIPDNIKTITLKMLKFGTLNKSLAN